MKRDPSAEVRGPGRILPRTPFGQPFSRLPAATRWTLILAAATAVFSVANLVQQARERAQRHQNLIELQSQIDDLTEQIRALEALQARPGAGSVRPDPSPAVSTSP